jgi:hypothetical protein
MTSNGKASAIRNAPTTNRRVVVVNEWRPDDMPEDEDFKLYVRSLSGNMRLKMERLAVKGRYKKSPDDLRLFMLRNCVFDDNEMSIATFADFSVEEITDLNPIPRERIFDAALLVSGLKTDEVDELVGN